MASLVIVGLGYSGAAVARAATTAGYAVVATSRDPSRVVAPKDVRVVRFDMAGEAIRDATHLLSTAAPEHGHDPALTRHAAAIAAAPSLRWLGYLSTTGVYGDRGGGWVDEATPPAPSSERGARRVAAETAWSAFAGRCAVDLFRVAGIYGPGRSVLDEVRSGRSRRVRKSGHAFGRIHRDDIARAVVAAMGQQRPPGVRVLNLTDDEPAASADVIAEAARLLGVPAPPTVPFAEALAGMSAMGASFWAENRRVRSIDTKAALGIDWAYPTYREGLAGILAEELAEGREQ